MKMGTIRSLSRYDARACHALLCREPAWRHLPDRCYAKSEKEDLTDGERREIRKLVVALEAEG